MSLYETLGVPPDADKAAIRSAFRRRAKETHPDAGGSAETFQSVELAHRILTDDERRARYDETGQVDEGAGNDEARAISIIAQMVDHALTKDDLKHHDLVGDIRKQINSEIETARQNIKEAQKYLDRAADARKRATVKKGRNLLAGLIDKKAAAAKQAQTMLEQQIKLRERALAMLEDASFDFEARPAHPVWGQGFAHVNDAADAMRYATMNAYPFKR